jgi:hypothetical protein
MTFKMAKRWTDVLHSANKNCKVFKRMLENDAITKILLFKGFGDDLIPSDSGSSESEMKWLCEKCGVPPSSRDVLHEMLHCYNCQFVPYEIFIQILALVQEIMTCIHDIAK